MEQVSAWFGRENGTLTGDTGCIPGNTKGTERKEWRRLRDEGVAVRNKKVTDSEA